MKYYLIYYNESIYAYTDDKKIKDAFLKLHPDSFVIIPIKKKRFMEYLNNNPDFSEFELIYYNGYRTTNEVVIRDHDINEFEFVMMSESIEFKHSLLRLLGMIDCLKISEDDRKFLTTVLYRMIDLVDDLTLTEHEVVYDELIDVLKFIKYWYRP